MLISEMLKGILLVLLLTIVIAMFIVEPKLVMFSKLILIKLFINELDQLKNYLVLELVALKFYLMET
jgi:hypothetical protein